MNSGLLPLWQNESLCKTLCMKMHVTFAFILLKIKSFSCEMFCTTIQAKKEANSNSEVEVKSAYEPSGRSDRHLSRFLQQYQICQYLFIHLSGKRHCESCVLLKNTIKCSQQRLEARLLEIDKKYKKSNNRLFTQTAHKC